MKWSVLGTGQGVQRAVQGTPQQMRAGGSGGDSLCVHTSETVSSHLVGVHVCPAMRTSCVSVWLARVNTRGCSRLGQCNPQDEPAVLGKQCCFQQAFIIIACDPEL